MNTAKWIKEIERMPVAVLILLITLIGIAIRRMTRIIIPIWFITTMGAAAALLFKQITPSRAIAAIEPEVMLYLFGVFSLHKQQKTVVI